MGKKHRGRGGSGPQGGGSGSRQGGYAGKGNRAATVYAGVPRTQGPGPGQARGNAVMQVIARDPDGRVVARWQGPMNWPADRDELPIEFTGMRAGREWTWSDARADELCLDSATATSCGIAIMDWAEQRGAAALQVTIVSNPGASAADASPAGLGTRGQGPGEDTISQEPDTDGAGAAARSRAVDQAFENMFADLLGLESHKPGRKDGLAGAAGLSPVPGAQGTGPAQGARGERAITGRGDDAGTRQGAAHGSDAPSWYTRPGAVADNESGGRTPDLEHGTPGGSAAGERDGEGHFLGLWNGPVDVAATVAVAINAVIVLLDADVYGLGEKLLAKVIKGLGGKRLRKALAEEAAHALDKHMPAVEAQLARDPVYRAMNRTDKKALRAQARGRLEHAYYARARAYFATEAARAEALVQQSAGASDEIAAHHRQLAQENARAFRKLEQVAADSGGLDIKDHIDAAWARQGKSGDGVEAESMHATSPRGAGVTRHGLTERHHVLPQQLKGWFQERGFPGNDIDAYCVTLDVPDHQALHGGGNFRLGQEWEDAWNKLVKKKLDEAEEKIQRSDGRKLNRHEVLAIVRELMEDSPVLKGRPFTHYRAKQ